MNKTLTVTLLILAMTASASNMDNAAKEGYELAEKTQKQTESALKDFQPQNELPNFTASPNEADFYQDASKIGNAANQSLNDSELGKLARETYINNPKDKIDWQSDMVKNSQTIQENAEGITAGSAEQCSKKSISQSTFKAKGYQLGRQDGVKEATRQLARQLLSDGVARENIKRYTSLSDSELDKL